MHRDGTLGVLFGTLLFGVIWPSGCGSLGYGGGVCSSPYRRRVEPDTLAVALADGELADGECELLCAASTSPNTALLAATGSDTGTGTDTGTMETGTNSGTDTGASTGVTTGTDTTAALTTSASTTIAPTTTAREDESWTEYEPGPLHKCTAVQDSVDLLDCWYVDCAYGRRPAGLRPCGPTAVRGAARLFAEAARLEAASGPAFERLAAALDRHGAPASLRARALAAAADERRHARAMAALAVARGGDPVEPEIEDSPEPDLLALACDNAAQGCVGETWGALIARHQAYAAEDPRVRATLSRIADDETRHAELAWAIDEWLEPRLSVAERAAVTAARAGACRALRGRLAAAVDEPALLAVGIPRRATALALFDGLQRALWQ